jgi:hexosaminidase
MGLFERKRPVVGVRCVHLDLKGMPPTPKRFLEILDLLAELRINAVLVEWEDTYPWETYPELRCETAYSRAHVVRFLERARRLGIEVIPLVQCYGHAQTVLSRRRFRKLQEMPGSVDDLCGSNPESREVVIDMVEDVLETHRGYIRHFHLGGDEIWSMGSCPRCGRAIKRKGKAGLYMSHVGPILDEVNAQGVRPLLWDDMMRRWPMTSLRSLAKRTDLVSWGYRPELFASPARHRTIDRFRRAGITIWGASAFKGADGVDADLPVLENRAKNMLDWIKECGRSRLVGVIATGWSRYSTSVVPCDSMEVSLDSLVVAAAAMWDGSVPKEYVREAEMYLRRKKLSGLAGNGFLKRREIMRSLSEWKKRAEGAALTAHRMCELSGEPDRRSPYRIRQMKKGFAGMLKEGENLGREFVRSQRGFVPKVWLDRYVASRLIPVRKLGAAAGLV